MESARNLMIHGKRQDNLTYTWREVEHHRQNFPDGQLRHIVISRDLSDDMTPHRIDIYWNEDGSFDTIFQCGDNDDGETYRLAIHNGDNLEFLHPDVVLAFTPEQVRLLLFDGGNQGDSVRNYYKPL
jgi:hypothetical protein